jgi:hypothetical protein
VSERTLDAGEYLLGAAELGIIIAAFWFAAVRLRRAALPGFQGPPALVCDIVGALTLAIVMAELLGTFGWFTDLGYLIGAVAVAALSLLPTRGDRPLDACNGSVTRGDSPLGDGGETPRRESETPPAPPSHRLGLPIVAVVVAAVAAGWAIPTLSGITGGMSRADSLWYHMPLSLRFAETGSTGDIFFFDPIFFASFYPANTELLHSIPILAFERDFISPLLNLGFLAVGFVAAWAIGRPYGLAPQALLGAAVILGAETMTDFQAGEALNDIGGVAFVLCAVAILVNGHASRPQGDRIGPGALAFAGAAAGLAAGSKFSFLAPIALLTVALLVIAPRASRLTTAAWFGLPMLLAGGYWYLRNLVQVGNPIPFTSWGPLGLPAPERGFELRPGYSVAHYWDQPEIWWDWFAPKLSEELGPLWPLVLIGVVGGGAYAIWKGRDPMLRALGAVAFGSALAYVVTPLTAGGEEGEPIAFEWNIRYLAPAVAIGLAVLPLLPVLRDSPRRRSITLFALGGLALLTTLTIAQWSSQSHIKGAVATGILVLAAFVGAAWAMQKNWLGYRAPALRRSSVLAAAVLVAVVGGYLAQNHYLERRYESLSPKLMIAPAARWANTVQDERIAVSGIRGVFNQYAFTGPDLSNQVRWLGVEGEDSAYLRIADCETWRREVSSGGFSYVVTLYDPFDPGALTDTKEALWMREDPGATEIVRDGPVSVFRIDEPLNPDACGDLPDLDPAELNGDSVNEEPLANQPPPGSGSGSQPGH